MSWIDLISPEQLQDIRSESQETPVMIFKHSTTCSVSAMAMHRLQRTSAPRIKTYYLDLKAYRNISNLIESTFEVEHESPQILIIKKGEAVYHRSHGDISASDISDFLEATN